MKPMIKKERLRYFQLLSEKYPTTRSLTREIINLSAILNLPKGTEHFLSDIHGEYEAFCHIINSCSSVVREKAELVFSDTLSHEEIKELCTLIYYPREKLMLMRKAHQLDVAGYRRTLVRLIEIARAVSSKYTRSKVRKAMPADYAYIIDELLHAQKDEDDNQIRYHAQILDTIIRVDADSFIIALCELIKRLAVDHLHIVGDIFDRGDSPDRIIDLLCEHHSLDIEWGNHDILWMGAACGSDACIANVVKNCIRYHTERVLENGYGISLRNLALFSEKTYPTLPPMKAAQKAITVIAQKIEGMVIMRNPDYKMDHRLLLDKMDLEKGEITIDGKTYPLNDTDFPTLNKRSPYTLTREERAVMDELSDAFSSSEKLKRHVTFLYENGGMYRCFNNNLLFHGCVPLNKDGTLADASPFGEAMKGKELFDAADTIARHAFFGERSDFGLDFMWYLWCGEMSPLCGRKIKSFERAFIDDKHAWKEEKNPYYRHYYRKEVCEMILEEFGLDPAGAHIINGHTPVRTTKGELPIRAEGKLLVIDGGFSKGYQKTTGIAGYTLIYNSHGMRLKAHHPFRGVDEALKENRDIHSDCEIVETGKRRMMVADTDDGKALKEEIEDLSTLLSLYRSGVLTPKQ